MSKIKLEVGKTYRTRDGKEVKITGCDGGHYHPYQGNNDGWYAESGKRGCVSKENPEDLIEEVFTKATRHTFSIPDGVKEITLSYEGNQLVVDMVPVKEPKPGDVMGTDKGSVYIFKSVEGNHSHNHYAWLGGSGLLSIGGTCYPGHPATPEEAQPLWDALKKAGKRWNPETMQVEDVPEIDRIREWAEKHYSNYQGIAEAIEAYLKYRGCK